MEKILVFFSNVVVGSFVTLIGISLIPVAFKDLAVGVGVTVVPNIFYAFPSLLSMLLSNGLFMVSITAIILNIVFNFNDIRKSLVLN